MRWSEKGTRSVREAGFQEYGGSIGTVGIAYTPRPATAGRGRGPTRQRWEGEGRPLPWCRAARENGGSLVLRRGEERGNRDAPHPPIASQWAPPSPRFAGERCMGGAWPRHGGPKMCASDSGESRDPLMSTYGCFPVNPSHRWVGPHLRRD